MKPSVVREADSLALVDFDRVQPGDEVHLSKTITAEDVEMFAGFTGDRNPVHIDAHYAARTTLGRPIAHGMLLAGYVSTLVGMRCPGPGALWVRQELRWPMPSFAGDQIEFTLRVTHKSVATRTLTIQVNAMNQNGKVVMEGEGAVLALEETRPVRDLPVAERVAFVTETRRPIGAAIALALAKEGAAVAIPYCGPVGQAQELCAEIEAAGGRAIPVHADLEDPVSIVEALQQIQARFNHPVDLLVNCGGEIPQPQTFMETTWEEIQAIVNSQLRGTYHCCQAVIPGMAEQKSGRIINLGSAFARGVPPVNQSGFLVAKSAVQGLTRSLAAELGPLGIRVNMVSTATVEKEFTAQSSERMRKIQGMQTPLRRLASPCEIAAAVAALCSTAGDFITGVDIPVCGGFQI